MCDRKKIVRFGMVAALLVALGLCTAGTSFAACSLLSGSGWSCIESIQEGYVFGSANVGVQQSGMAFTNGEIQVYYSGSWHYYGASSGSISEGPGSFDCPSGGSEETFGSRFWFNRNSGTLPNGTYNLKLSSNGGAQWSATSNSSSQTITNCP